MRVTFSCSELRVWAVIEGMGELIELSAGNAPRERRGESHGGAWGAVSEALWPAWSGMQGAEARVLDTFGEMLGEKLLVLWALSRFGEEAPGEGTLAELVDEGGRPRFGDWLAEDMLFAAFSLGVAWASEAREVPAQPPAAENAESPKTPAPRAPAPAHARRRAI
jgi:hypothetical protein